MQVELTPEQSSFVDLGIQEGRFRDREEAVQRALAQWEKRERARVELLASLDLAEQVPRCRRGRDIYRGDLSTSWSSPSKCAVWQSSPADNAHPSGVHRPERTSTRSGCTLRGRVAATLSRHARSAQLLINSGSFQSFPNIGKSLESESAPQRPYLPGQQLCDLLQRQAEERYEFFASFMPAAMPRPSLRTSSNATLSLKIR